MRVLIPITLAVAVWACTGRSKQPLAPIPERAGPVICAETTEFVWAELPRPDAGVTALSPAVQEQVESGDAQPPPDGGAPFR